MKIIALLLVLAVGCAQPAGWVRAPGQVAWTGEREQTEEQFRTVRKICLEAINNLKFKNEVQKSYVFSVCMNRLGWHLLEEIE
jgi:hypothetical protein